MRQGIFHSPRPNDRNALLPRIIHRICRAALTACAVANANVAVIDHVAVPLEHASPRVTLGKIYHLIRPPFDGFIEQSVRFPPLFRLIAAGESQNQLHLRVEAPRFQNGLRCERIKAQGSAAVKGGDALLDQLFDDFLQPLLQVKKIVLWNSSMACKAATIHKKGRLSARYKGISLKTV